jgi:predicted dehydrogenase
MAGNSQRQVAAQQMMKLAIQTLVFAALLTAGLVRPGSGDEPLRAGIIGCDTSHAVAFAKLLNAADAPESLARVRIVAAFPGGSPDLPASRDRIAGFTQQLQDLDIELVDSISQLVERSDVIFLESVDGRVHLDQFREAAVGKPVFIDKPAAASLVDVLAIFRHAEATNTPCFTSSALRYCDQVRELQADASLGKIVGCETTTPYVIEPTHPPLFWYGIHGVESLYALMGPGCEAVSCTETDSAAVVVGRWADGRLGVMRGLKSGKADYSFTVFGATEIAYRRGFSGYQPLVESVCEFFVTHQAPVPHEETIEMFAFMEAAHESQRENGRLVALGDVLARAERQLDDTSSP